MDAPVGVHKHARVCSCRCVISRLVALILCQGCRIPSMGTRIMLGRFPKFRSWDVRITGLWCVHVVTIIAITIIMNIDISIDTCTIDHVWRRSLRQLSFAEWDGRHVFGR